jgi:hypothetical protein
MGSVSVPPDVIFATLTVHVASFHIFALALAFQVTANELMFV